MRSRTETEIAFMGMLKVSSLKSSASAPRLLNILLRKLPGQVLEKFQIFSDTTAGSCGFRLWGAQAASLQSQRAMMNREAVELGASD
jgi:hypothetical protein